MDLGDGQANSVGETLAERAGGDFNAGRVVSFGVTGADAVNRLSFVSGLWGPMTALCTYSESLQVVQCDSIPKQVEKSILQHAPVAVTATVNTIPWEWMSCLTRARIDHG